MTIHPIEPIASPSDARFEKSDPYPGETLQDAAADDVHAGGLLLERMADHVEGESIMQIAVRAERGHLGAKARMDRDGNVELLCLAPEDVVSGIAEPAAVERIGTDEDGLEVQVAHHAAHLFHGRIDILKRHRRDAVKPLRIGPAEVRHPVVVGAAGRHREARLFEVAIQ